MKPSIVAAVLSAFALSSLGGPPPARADGTPPADAAASVKTALADLDASVKAKDDSAAAKAAKKLGDLYKDAADQKPSILKELVSTMKQAKLTDARKAALDALVATEDGEGAWKAGLQGAYPNNDADDPSKFNLDIVTAVGTLHPEGAIDTLLETFRKAKGAELQAAGVAALGNYHAAKRRREQILEEIVKAGKNMMPSRSKTHNPSQEEQGRWNTVGQAIGKALDNLTGTQVGSPVEWFKKVDDAKKDYKKLFKD